MTPEPIHQTPTRRFGSGQIAAMISAGIVALLAAGLVAAGAFALWGNAQKDSHGYIASGYDRYATTTHAIATDDLDIDLDGLTDVAAEGGLGSIRVKAAPGSGKPLFVGVARTADVTRYLGGTSHDVLTDVEYSPFRADYARHGGMARPAAPAEQGFWAASAQGASTQTVRWDVRDGNWSVVVMNADGSAGVDAGVSAGVELPWLSGLGWGLVGGGTLLLVIAGAITLVALIGPRRPMAATPVAA